MDDPIEITYVDPEQLWQESLEWHDRAQREDEEAVRSGRISLAELHRRNRFFQATRDWARIDLDSARRLS